MLEKYVWVLNLLLIFLLCYFTAGAVNAYLSRRYLASFDSGPAAAMISDTKTGKPSQSYQSRDIVDRNIFGVQTGWEREVDLTGDIDGDIQESTLRAKLLGVVYFFKGANLNRATIRLIQENKSDVYREGDELIDDVKVASIEIRRVILMRSDGTLEELSLAELEAEAGSKGKRGKDRDQYVPKFTKLPPDERREALRQKRELLGIDNRIQKVSDTEYIIERSAITDALSDLNTLFTQMRLVPNFTGEGENKQVEGFKVFRIKPNSVFQKLGVKSGDVILEINGAKMDNPEKGFELLQQIRYENSFSLMLQRNDEEVIMSYQVRD